MQEKEKHPKSDVTHLLLLLLFRCKNRNLHKHDAAFLIRDIVDIQATLELLSLATLHVFYFCEILIVYVLVHP